MSKSTSEQCFPCNTNADIAQPVPSNNSSSIRSRCSSISSRPSFLPIKPPKITSDAFSTNNLPLKSPTVHSLPQSPICNVPTPAYPEKMNNNSLSRKMTMSKSLQNISGLLPNKNTLTNRKNKNKSSLDYQWVFDTVYLPTWFICIFYFS